MTWANQVRILKQNFQQLAAIIGGTLINALKPLIKAFNSAMTYVIAFAETISNALGKIFGWTFQKGGTGVTQDFESASGYADDLADSTGAAADNVKKMKAGLRAFDELKTISMPDTSAGSGGGGGAGGGLGTGTTLGGDWQKGETLWEKYESEIDNLYELGKYIQDALNKSMESINWNAVYEKARNFGTGLADFLNGLISPRLFGNIAKTIAGGLNTIITAFRAFGEQFDFENLGLSIASAINNFFATFDFVNLAKTLNVWAHGLLTTIKTALANIKWADAWEKVKEFFSELKLETVAVIIGAITIKKILGLHLGAKVLSWIAAEISKKLAQAIAAKLGFDLAKNAGLGTALGKAAKTITTKLGSGIWDAWLRSGGLIGILTKNPQAVMATGSLSQMGVWIATGILGGIAAAIGGWKLGTWIYETFTGKEAPTFEEDIEALKEIVTFDNWLKGWEGISEWWNGVVEPLRTGWDQTVSNWQAKWNEAKEGWDNFKSNWQSSWNDIKANAQSGWDNVVSNWQSGWEIIKTTSAEKWTEFQTNWRNGWDIIKADTVSAWNATKDNWMSGWNTIVDWWNNNAISKWWSESVAPWFTKEKWTNAMSGVGEAFRNVWNGAVASIKEIWNKFATWLNSKLKFKIDPINIGGKQVFEGKTINLGKIPTFQTGGFPESASLFFAGENGIPEIVGSVGGRTAVASGTEITGIADAVYSTGQTEASLLQTAVGLLEVIAEKEYGISSDAVFKSVRNSAKNYSRRTGRLAFDF